MLFQSGAVEQPYSKSRDITWVATTMLQEQEATRQAWVLRALRVQLALQLQIFTVPGLSYAGSRILKLICHCGPQWIPELLYFPAEIRAHAASLTSSGHIIFTLQALTICAATVQYIQGCIRPSGPVLWCWCTHLQCSANTSGWLAWLITQNYCFTHSVVTKSQTNSLNPQTWSGKQSWWGTTQDIFGENWIFSSPVSVALRTTWQDHSNWHGKGI